MMSFFDFPSFYHDEPPMDIVVWTTEPESSKQITTMKPRSDDFKLDLHVPSFKPDELKVSLDGQMLVVEGSHTEESEQGSFESTFHRRLLLPRHVDAETLTTTLDDKGRLSIHAQPKALESKKKEPKAILIGLKDSKEE